MILKKLILILALIVFNTNLAQTIEGKVVYLVSLNSDTFIEQLKKNSKMPENVKRARLRDALKARPMNFFLLFKGNESLYHSEFDLNTQRDLGMGMNTTGTVAGDDYISYNNLETKENFRQSFWMDKIIINVDHIRWQLTQETKKIGKYNCYKATATLIEEQEQGGYLSNPIIAWYTPQIPITFGVQNFGGLPGLTLELRINTKKGNLFYKATKIELNPKEKILIKKPKGKAISHKEFIELIRKARKR